MKRLVVEGWKRVNHSFAMVNQNQLLEWAQVPGLELFHREAPPFMKHWNSGALTPGFGSGLQRVLDALPEPDGKAVNCTFRIAAPIAAPKPDQKTVTFVVTEFGLSEKSFVEPGGDLSAYTRDENVVVTPSAWSRERLIEYGFDGDKVKVVPHGVRAESFHPMTVEQRTERRMSLGYGPEHVVFLNVGVATWNKGIDLLITAFARLRKKHAHARLILKDGQGLYGIGVQPVIQGVVARHPHLIDEQILKSISVISDSLNQAQLRELYGVSDYYVSPYRAEGFNLPVLEAMACGTRAIVTAGGATDDFVCNTLADRIRASPRDARSHPQVQGPYLEPDLDALIERMEIALTRTERSRPDDGFVSHYASRMGWKTAADLALSYCV